MNRNNIYTKSERTVKKYTVGEAVESAKRALKGIPLCINAIQGRELSEKITLEELNNIRTRLIDDSHWYNY